jgi:hypothetical protein
MVGCHGRVLGDTRKTRTMNSDKPTLTQVQIIQSLAEALSWFEKEIR